MKTFTTDSMATSLIYYVDASDNTVRLSFGTPSTSLNSAWADADDLEQLAKKFRKMARKLREKEQA